MCKPGSYSAHGFEPCKPCKDGYYQLSSGKTYCLPCTNYTIISQCHSGEKHMQNRLHIHQNFNLCMRITQ